LGRRKENEGEGGARKGKREEEGLGHFEVAGKRIISFEK